MSHLALYCPEDVSHETEARILPFTGFEKQDSPQIHSLAAARAKRIFQNRSCPTCSTARIVPLSLNAGTVVGFHCFGCGNEWPAS